MRSSWEETRTRDRDLVAACRRGDERSWERIWHEYGRLVKAVTRRTGCTADEADDVLQRAALVALEGLERLRDGAKLAGWLAGIARFQSFEVIRQRRPSEELFEATAVFDDGDVDETVGHGTFVASVVALVAPRARIVPCRVLDDDGRGSAYQLAPTLADAAGID